MAWYDDEYKKPEKNKINIDFSKLKDIKNKFNFPQLPTFILIFIIGWIASGFYIVSPQEVGVVKRFGKYSSTVTPGPHWHIPYPVEEVFKPEVTRVYRLEIGFRTIPKSNPAKYREVPEESYMLTGDENIVKVEFIVQFRIKDPVKFLFNVKNQYSTVFKTAEAAIREVVGSNKIDSVLTSGKEQIQIDCKNLLQDVLDSYDIGVNVVTIQLQDVHPPKEVINAFKDVASAKEDKERLINEALGYNNDIIPKAKGEAAQIINDAKGYKEAIINKAIGETNRFDKVLTQFMMNKDITKKRIYIETMQQIFKESEKVIVDSKASSKILPLLNLGNGEKNEK